MEVGTFVIVVSVCLVVVTVVEVATDWIKNKERRKK
jgi:ABC-type nickel/cobalt efflux system permease component RcnA